MTIVLNNNTETLDAPEGSLSIKQLLAAKNWSFPLIIVRLNGALVAKEQWEASRIHEGDNVEALHLVSGG